MVVYLIGPRVSLDTTLKPVELPNDLDAWLHASESRYRDITPGAEKTIVWADASNKSQTEIAFVYLHGFSATRQESVPVPDNIARHFGSNLYFTRLAGNGRSDDALAQGSVNKWVNDASEALAIAARLGRRTVVIGCSTGASLAWWTAHQQQFSHQIAAMIFLSPNFGVADPRAGMLLYPWGAQLAKLIVGPYRESETSSDEHARYWTNRYPVEALLPMMGMVKLAKQYDAAGCRVPVQIIYSRHDDTVSVVQIKAFCQQLPDGNDVIEVVQPDGASQHVIAGNILAPENNEKITSAVVEFLERKL